MSRTDVREKLLKDLNDRFGGRTLFVATDESFVDVDVIPTGSLDLDMAIGPGGYPRGRSTVLIGNESSGKTTLLLAGAAEAQRVCPGEDVAIVDAEHAVDPAWAEVNGVDLSRLYLSQPDSAEQALDVALALVKSGLFPFVGFDSMAAMVPQAELNAEMGDAQIALRARLMSRAFRVLPPVIREMNVAFIWINQWRNKIGISFGDPRVMPGGYAVKYGPSVIVELLSKGKGKIIKNKVGPPYRYFRIPIKDKPIGLDSAECAVRAGKRYGVIEQKGAWTKWETAGMTVQGIESFTDAIRHDSMLLQTLREEVLATRKPHKAAESEAEDVPLDDEDLEMLERADTKAEELKKEHGKGFQGSSDEAAEIILDGYSKQYPDSVSPEEVYERAKESPAVTTSGKWIKVEGIDKSFDGWGGLKTSLLEDAEVLEQVQRVVDAAT